MTQERILDMNEIQRLDILKQLEEEKEKMKILREKLKRFNFLKDNDIVKEYLELEDELYEEKILEEDEVQKKVFDRLYHNRKCNHDVYFYIGGYTVEYDHGPESRDKYYREFDENKIEYYSYYCLDCFMEEFVPKREHEKFVKNNKIIKLNKKYIYSEDFRMFQRMYFELLLENSTEEAIKKLVKVI